MPDKIIPAVGRGQRGIYQTAMNGATRRLPRWNPYDLWGEASYTTGCRGI